MARLAEDAYGALRAAEQVAARRLVLRLAGPADDGPGDIGRRLPLDDVAAATDVATWGALDRLAARRLLTVDGGTVALAHEALLREWPRVRGWLDEDTEGQRVHRHLEGAARAWHDGGAVDADLYRGPRLAAALEWAGRAGDAMNDLERAFLDESARRHEAAQEELTQRLRRERRVNRRLRGLLIAVAVVLVVAVVAAVAAVVLNGRANREADRATAEAGRAEDRQLEANVRRLVAQSRVLRDSSLDVSLLLALEANRLADDPETRGALQTALVTDPRLVGFLQGGVPYYRAAVSADGGRVALGSTGGALEVWDVATHELVAGPVMVGEPVVGMWWEGDGQVLTASGDGTVRRWAPESASPSSVLADAGAQVLGADLSPDGRSVVMNLAAGGTARIDLSSAERIGPSIASRAGLLGSVRYSPDGSVIATVAGDLTGGALELWDPATGERVGVLANLGPGGRGLVNMAFSPDGGKLVALDDTGATTVWDVIARQPVVRLDGVHRDFVYSAAFDPAGSRVATVGQDGLAVLWDAATGAPIGTAMDGNGGPTYAVAFTPDGRLVTAGVDGSAAIWDPAASGSLARRIGEGPTTSVAVDPDGDLLAVVAGQSVLVYDRSSGALVSGPLVTAPGITALSFDPSGERLAVAVGVSVHVFDVASGRPAGAPLEGHRAPVAGLAFSPDGRRLASGGYDDLLIVHDVASGDMVAAPAEHPHWVLGVAYSPAGDLLATASFDGTLRLYDPATVAAIDDDISADGFHGAASVAFAPDGATFATGSGDGTVTVWHTDDRRPTQTFAPHAAAVYQVAYDSTGTLLITASTDATARVVDAATGIAIGEPWPKTSVGTVALGGDDEELLVAGTNGVTAWALDPQTWRETACAVVGRNLSPAEWDEYLAGLGSRRATCPQYEL